MSTTANSAAASDSDRLITALQSLAKKQEGQGEKLYRAVPTTDKNAAFWNPWYSTDFQKNLDLDWALIFCIILASIELGFLHIIQIESQLAVEHSPTLFVVVQSMLYISLFATFLAALIVASGQHWPPNHQAAGSRGTAVEQRGLGRHYELDGSVTWRSKAVLQGFPLLLQLALMLSMSSISVYLITVHHPVAILVTVLIALGLGSYIFLLVSATIFPNCPFQTPLGSILVSCIKAVKSVLFHQQGEQGKKLYRMVEAPTTDNKKAAFWNSYMKLANKHDKEFQQKYGSGFDTALVFCCFFMAVEPEFISKIEPQLAVEYPPTIIVIVQSMMYISLFAALLAALLAVLGKQWLVYYQAAGTGTIEECGLKRQHKLDGLVQWKFEALLQGIPLLLQLALFLFASSTLIYRWTVPHSVPSFVTDMTALGLGSYAFLLVLATMFYDFQTPLRPLWPILAPIEAIKSVLSRPQYTTSRFLHRLPRFFTSNVPYTSRGSKLNILPICYNSVLASPEVPAVLWVLNTSTDPAMICLAAELGVNLQWPLNLGQSGKKAVNHLETTLLACLDDDPLRVSASSVNSDMGSPENTHLEFINSHSLNGRIIPDSWDPFAVGASANVYKGTLFRPNGHKIPVAIKMLLSNRNDGDQEYTLKQLKREANIWAPLNHKHLVPFLGICDDISRWPCLISPLYNHGHVGKFIRNNPTANRGALILGVALGLEYLHEKDIIHGDLKVANVFVDEDSIPRIADFGISKIVNRRGYTTWSIGTPSYMAPELFHVLTPTAEKEVYPRTTKSSDVYSFNLLALEISISKPPRGRPSRPFLTVEQLSGLRPQRMDYSTVPDETWSILDRGWELEPNDRPTISELRLQLSSAFDNTKG